jgi:ATP-dependent exoDNAse (exonuclease V) beta subunit
METLDPQQQPDDAARMAAIRDLLAHFDWEHHDRQLALEAIDRIADPGWDGAR